MDTQVMLHYADVLMMLPILAFVGFMTWLALRAYQSSMRMRFQRAEAFNKLLERFSSAKEFADFLQTEQGKQFLREPMPAPRAPMAKVARLVQFGIVIVSVGVGGFINAYRLQDATDLNLIYQANECRYWGTFAVAIGMGLLLTGLVTYLLARRWHLANGVANGHS